MTSLPEFSRLVKLRPLPAAPVTLTANETECTALAARFGIPAIAMLAATVELEQQGKAVRATGELTADITQNCAISGEEFAVSVREPLALRFVEESELDRDPALEEGDIEVELSADELDEIGFSGDAFDLGEAVAQSLGLAIDPYAEGPNADGARKSAGITGDDVSVGPLASALAALKKD